MTPTNGTTSNRNAPLHRGMPNSDSFSGRLGDALRNTATAVENESNDLAQTERLDSATPRENEPQRSGFAGPVGAGEHLVKQGECIASIAKEAGHFWETIWNDAANRELREARKNPNILLPEDRVHVPPLRQKYEPGQTEMRHRFRRRGEPSIVRVRVLRRDGQPRAQEPYVLRIDQGKWEGLSDANGWIQVPIEGDAREGKLVVGPPGDQAKYTLALGGVDPIDAVSGVQQRLNNLGFAVGPCDGVLGPATRTALLRFQKHHAMSETGEPDAPTRAKLVEQHSS